MRVVEVDPEEPGRPRPFCPGQGLVDDGAGPGFGELPRHARRRGKAVVVDVESLGQPEARVQGVAADERRRGVAAGLQQLGEGLKLRRDDEAPVVADAVGRRRPADEQAGVGRERQGDVGESPSEDRPRRREPVDVGGPDVVRVVAAQAVGAERVDGDEQEIEAGLGSGAGRAGRMSRPREGGRGRTARRTASMISASIIRPSRPPLLYAKDFPLPNRAGVMNGLNLESARESDPPDGRCDGGRDAQDAGRVHGPSHDPAAALPGSTQAGLPSAPRPSTARTA